MFFFFGSAIIRSKLVRFRWLLCTKPFDGAIQANRGGSWKLKRAYGITRRHLDQPKTMLFVIRHFQLGFQHRGRRDQKQLEAGREAYQMESP